MKHYILLAGVLLLHSFGFSIDGNKYQYNIDLNKAQGDSVQVNLVPPAMKPGDALFRLPKIVPGTYHIYDFGRFVTDLKVTPKSGKTCKVEKVDANSWKISNADQIASISYWVADTWDTEDTLGDWVFEPAGTNIDEQKNFVLNNHGFFGYFEGMTQVPYEVNVTRPNNFYGSTGLTFTTSGNTDTYQVPNYNTLVDSPIMYNEPDTAWLKVGNATVLVSVYNASKSIKSSFIAQNIEQILNAQKEYLGGQLPVDKYAFLIYLPDDYNHMGFGALEHSNSSFYFLPAFAGGDYLAGMIRDVSAHEFFHILTPLTIHSEEIQFFDFNNPKMSQHLWLYEGCTEYAAHHVQVQYGIISPDDFIEVMYGKIKAAKGFNDTVPFTVMSKGCLDKYEDQYLNVYQKGALIGMCLDLKLLHLSKGSMNLQGLMRKLSTRFGKEKAFKDDELFAVITELSYPEIGDFLRRHVGGSEPLPFEEILGYAGVEFQKDGTREVLDFGMPWNDVGYDEENKTFYLTTDENITEVGRQFGFQTGDVLTSVDGKPATLEELPKTVKNLVDTKKPTDELEYEISRKNKKGKIKVIKLKGKIATKTITVEGGLAPVENLSQQQQSILQSWLVAQ